MIRCLISRRIRELDKSIAWAESDLDSDYLDGDEDCIRESEDRLREVEERDSA